MSGDHFPNKYFPERYFPGTYFQGGEQNPGAISASLTASASLTGSIIGVERVSGGSGSWNLSRIKRRAKRRTRYRDIGRFIDDIEEVSLVEAPVEVQEQARDALDAAHRAIQVAEIAAYREALKQINEFYALVRAEAKRRRDEADAEDEEMLLLAA